MIFRWAWNSSVLTSAESDERSQEMMGIFTVVAHVEQELLLPSFDSEPDRSVRTDI